ncbi:MAG: hypothetical protein H3C34_00905 [Caldilineaceae bacterium]|nr:hypothetical protein [Caldilineaceae bacterium]
MDRYTVACVQQRLRVPLTVDELRENSRRFLRAAENRRARLVVFPELAGVMLVPPLLGDFRSSLLKRADRGRRRSASLWHKVLGNVAGRAAALLKANFYSSMAGLLDIAAPTLWQQYVELFGGLAREFGMTVVAPSAYLPDPLDGVIRHLVVVFGPDGEVLGSQAKVVLNKEDEAFCQPGSTWDVIHTEVGALGIMLGGDVLYPEVGRLLAFQGAEALIAQAACANQAHYNKLRAGILARMQDNQLFAACAFLVGRNVLRPPEETVYLGKSAIFAPQELTPRFNGVLVEMGNTTSEGVLTAEWNFVDLKELWEKSDTPIRRRLPVNQANQLLTNLYRRLQSLPRLDELNNTEEDSAEGETEAAHSAPQPPAVDLEELSVIASVTSRWPPHSTAEQDEELPHEAVGDWSANPPDQPLVDSLSPDDPRFQEETDEMDALADGKDEKPAA